MKEWASKSQSLTLTRMFTYHSGPNMDQEFQNLRPEFDRKQIDNTFERLKRTRYPDSETVDDGSHGIPLFYTRDFVPHWTADYD